MIDHFNNETYVFVLKDDESLQIYSPKGDLYSDIDLSFSVHHVNHVVKMFKLENNIMVLNYENQKLVNLNQNDLFIHKSISEINENSIIIMNIEN